MAQEKHRQEKEGVTLQLGNGAAKGGLDANNPAALDQDTEWTQMSGTLGAGIDTLGELQEPTVFKRRSFGAATHLSRITEGAEEEDEDTGDAQSLRQGRHSSLPYNPSNVPGSRMSAGSSSIQIGGNGPRISVGSGTSFSSKNIIPIAYRPSPAGSDSGESPRLGSPALPATAHRAVGAPHVVVTGAKTPLRMGSELGAGKPMRPERDPQLNLRLADGAEPGQRGSGGGGSSSGQLSPAAPSSSHISTQFDFMSIDPAAALSESRVYSRGDRHLSTGTINTMASTSTAGLDYVLSAPQIVTPVTVDGARRVQLNKGGKAQLVRGGSLKRNGSTTDSATSRKDGAVSPVDSNSAADPFSDAAAAAAAANDDTQLLMPMGREPVMSSKASHSSTYTLGIPFAEGISGAGWDPKDASPIDADRSSWLDTSNSSNGRRDEGPFSDDAAESQSTRSDAARSASDQRSSQAESIGGLSVFDQFPFTIDSSSFPTDAKARIRSVAEKSTVEADQEQEQEQEQDGGEEEHLRL